MRCSSVLLFISFLIGLTAPAKAHGAKKCGEIICWEVENRFRLFTEKRDFEMHLHAWSQTAEPNRTLAMEHVLSASHPHGWAKEMVGRLCFNDYTNTVLEQCIRDDTSENYLNPLSFATRITVNAPKGFEDASLLLIAIAHRRILRPMRLVVDGLALRTTVFWRR